MFFCCGFPAKTALRLRPDRAEYRRPKQNSGDQLPHDSRLPDPLHRLAHQTPYQQQQHDLREEKRLRWSLHPHPPPRASGFQFKVPRRKR
jgi:hypothetical protein